MELNTFSISARCEKTGQLGVAVSSALPNVGEHVPYIKSGVGAIANQAVLNPVLGSMGLELLIEGGTAEEVLEAIISYEESRIHRQIGIVDNDGNSAVWTGEEILKNESYSWAGHLKGDNVTVQGNTLKNKDTVKSMYDTFKNTDDLDLKERLMMSLISGQECGGDKRGGDNQSAAVIIYSNKEYPLFDFRVNKHHSPVKELRKKVNG